MRCLPWCHDWGFKEFHSFLWWKHCARCGAWRVTQSPAVEAQDEGWPLWLLVTFACCAAVLFGGLLYGAVRP